MPTIIRSNLLLAFVAGVLLFAATPAHATPELRAELKRVAEALSKVLHDNGVEAVALGDFTGPPTLRSSAGTGIVQILSEELEKLNVTVKARAKVGLKGEFLVVPVEVKDELNPALTVKRLALRIKAAIVDEFGEVLTNFRHVGPAIAGLKAINVEEGKIQTDVRDESTLAELGGLSVSIATDTPVGQRDVALRGAISGEEPTAKIVEGSRVVALANGQPSPYAVEILVGKEARAAALKDNLPFVELQQGELYGVRLYNNSDQEAAVRLSIDGLSVFHFSELKIADGPQAGQPKYNYYLIPARSNIVITGWHVSNQQEDRFLVAPAAKGAAALLGLKSNLGTITAQFSAAWPIDQPPPADEPGAKRGGPSATARGPRVDKAVTEVQRKVGMLRASVSVRYSK